MKRILLFLTIVSFLFSCKNDGPSDSSISGIVPSSTGAADEVMFILPDGMLESSIPSSINQNYNEFYRILPTEETIFTTSKIAFSAVNNLMYRFRNIILVGTTQANDPVFNLAKETLSDEQIEKLNNGTTHTFIVNNIWSKPQTVVFILGDSENNIKTNISESAKDVIDYITARELNAYHKIAYINGHNALLEEKWEKAHQLSLQIPSEYKIAESNENFILFRKDITKGILFLMFDINYYNAEVPDANYGVQFRNDLGHYVESNEENSFMISDSTLGFQETKVVDGNIITYETSGLWRMENDFKGGPFINQYIIDNNKNRVILLDAFIFAPGEEHKKKYLRQVEAIFKTLKIQ